MNVADPVLEAIATVPHRIAFIVDETSLTYGALGDTVSEAAATLAARGIRGGHRVALAVRAGVPGAATVLACARLGAAAAPISPASTAAEIAALARAAGCGSLGVASADAAPHMEQALGVRPLAEGELLAGGSAVVPVATTSGTTGTPKPVPLTHDVLARRVVSFAPPIDPSAAPAVTIVCVPFHHVAGLVGVLVGLAGGATLVVQPRFDAGEWVRLVERHRVQRAFLVPTMLHRILEHPDLPRADVGSLQMVTYGAAPASADLIERAVAALPGASFINVFGQTETLGAVTALGPEDHRAGRAGSVGRPMPGVEVRIVDPATGADVAEGATGEFWVRAAHAAGEGWVHSGDLVRRDADGYLYPMGRLSDVINRGGEKIDPLEVEAVLRAHPAVADAAVSGVSDEEMGQRIGAIVVAREPVDPAVLRTWCVERLASYKVPERFAFADALPITELGKVSRRDVRDILARSDPSGT
jgi:acyl-CoA synthetase (AMP-forming)/AMP-acid ligase II